LIHKGELHTTRGKNFKEGNVMRRVSFICLLIPAFSTSFFSLPNLNFTEYRGNYKAFIYSQNHRNKEQGPPECSPGDMASTGGKTTGAKDGTENPVLKELTSKLAKVAEDQSIEITKQSVMKLRNCVIFQPPFEALKTNGSYKTFQWPGIFEFRNPGDKAIVITGFQVLWPAASYGGQEIGIGMPKKANNLKVFTKFDVLSKSVIGGPEPAPINFPVTIPPHATLYAKINLRFALLLGGKTLEFQNENEGYESLSSALKFKQGSDGTFRCGTGIVPVEISTADQHVLKYEPLAALLVPGCTVVVPPREMLEGLTK